MHLNENAHNPTAAAGGGGCGDGGGGGVSSLAPVAAGERFQSLILRPPTRGTGSYHMPFKLDTSSSRSRWKRRAFWPQACQLFLASSCLFCACCCIYIYIF